MSTRITKALARKELAYRALPKPRPARSALVKATHGIDSFDPGAAFHAGSDRLREIAGTTGSFGPKAAPAKAKSTRPAKKAKPVVDQNAKILRGLAWDMHLAAKAAGDKLTYAQACAALGVLRAKDERAAA